jgi:hypothetical protein
MSVLDEKDLSSTVAIAVKEGQDKTAKIEGNKT